MALHNAKSVKILFLIKESTLTENRGLPLRDLIFEVLGYAKGIDLKKFLPTVAVLITHCHLFKK